jgi:hypothetical protein
LESISANAGGTKIEGANVGACVGTAVVGVDVGACVSNCAQILKAVFETDESENHARESPLWTLTPFGLLSPLKNAPPILR